MKSGLGLAFTAIWRVTPHFGWGGGFDLSGFRSEPPSDLDLEDSEAGAAFIGLIGRAYPLAEGSFDPFFQLGLGGGALGTSAREPTPVAGSSERERFEETTAGGAIQIGGGIDFFLSRKLRLGPTLTYTKVFTDRIRRCRKGGDEDCSDKETSEYGHLDAFLRLNLSLTIMLGDEL